MVRLAVLLSLMMVPLSAWADVSTGSAPNADSSSPRTVAVTQQDTCPARPPSAEGTPSNIVVELDPDTLWRPRGAEVRFKIVGRGGVLNVTKVRVCFGWGNPGIPFTEVNQLVGSPQVRSVPNDTGTPEYGALVPALKGIPNKYWWPGRIFGPGPYVFTSAFTVPVSDMVVEVSTATGPPIVMSVQVGITSVIIGWVVAAVVLVLFFWTLHAIAETRKVPGRTLVLRVIATPDGYASLSQLQVLLWTLVVGLSAVYVMVLSGNLISITVGTLTLLGIASGAALFARLPRPGSDARSAESGDEAPADPAAPPAPQTLPEWADLLIPNRATQEIDITRVQMLAFTLISAAFVVVKVVVTYEIPEIPPNFLLLMGISNGVYVGGLQLPSRNKDGGVKPAE